MTRQTQIYKLRRARHLCMGRARRAADRGLPENEAYWKQEAEFFTAQLRALQSR